MIDSLGCFLKIVFFESEILNLIIGWESWGIEEFFFLLIKDDSMEDFGDEELDDDVYLSEVDFVGDRILVLIELMIVELLNLIKVSW